MVHPYFLLVLLIVKNIFASESPNPKKPELHDKKKRLEERIQIIRNKLTDIRSHTEKLTKTYTVLGHLQNQEKRMKQTIKDQLQ